MLVPTERQYDMRRSLTLAAAAVFATSVVGGTAVAAAPPAEAAPRVLINPSQNLKYSFLQKAAPKQTKAPVRLRKCADGKFRVSCTGTRA